MRDTPLGATVDDSLQRLNGTKALLQLLTTVVKVGIFAIAGHVLWKFAAAAA